MRVSKYTPEERKARDKQQRREQRQRAWDRMTPEQRAARQEYMRNWHAARKAGQLFGRSKLPAEEIRRRKNAREEERRERLRAAKPPREVLSPEEQSARKREYNRAYWHKRKASKPEPKPRIVNAKTICKPKPPGLIDCAKSHVIAAPARRESVEEFMARGGRIQRLPGLQHVPFLTVPTGEGWGGTRAA